MTPQFPVLLRRKKKAAPRSQTPLTEGSEGRGEYMYIPEGGGATLPTRERAGLAGFCHQPGPARCGGFRCPLKRSDGARRLALPVRAGSAATHPVPPGRGRTHPRRYRGQHRRSLSARGPRSVWQRTDTLLSCPRDRPSPGGSVAVPAFYLPASPHRASLSHADYKSQPALLRAARLSARREWRAAFWDAWSAAVSDRR